jgi:hypothetical protein
MKRPCGASRSVPVASGATVSANMQLVTASSAPTLFRQSTLFSGPSLPSVGQPSPDELFRHSAAGQPASGELPGSRPTRHGDASNSVLPGSLDLMQQQRAVAMGASGLAHAVQMAGPGGPVSSGSLMVRVHSA